MRPTYLAIFAGLIAIGSTAGFLTLNSSVMSPAFAQAMPAPCVCSTLEKLEYKPVSPAEPIARLFVGQCQCGAMSCVVTSGALQCMK
jgi:hypothetical protein